MHTINTTDTVATVKRFGVQVLIDRTHQRHPKGTNACGVLRKNIICILRWDRAMGLNCRLHQPGPDGRPCSKARSPIWVETKAGHVLCTCQICPWDRGSYKFWCSLVVTFAFRLQRLPTSQVDISIPNHCCILHFRQAQHWVLQKAQMTRGSHPS